MPALYADIHRVSVALSVTITVSIVKDSHILLKTLIADDAVL